MTEGSGAEKPRQDKQSAQPTDEKGLAGYLRRSFILIGIGPLVVVNWLFRNHQFERLPTALQWFLIALLLLSILHLLGLIFLPRFRRNWLDWNWYDPAHWWGYVLPLVNTTFVGLMATWGFAIISGFLYFRGLGTTSPENALSDPFNDCFMYYLWRLLNAIPVLEIPQTLGWEMRFRFTDHVNPVLLLLHKIVLIGPMIAIGKIFWKDARDLRAKGRAIPRRADSYKKARL